MFINLLKHYLRSITRRKLFSFINITGLAFSIAFLVLIGQFIDWWRGLHPANEIQHDAHARLPGAIRLLDTVSAWMAEQDQRN